MTFDLDLGAWDESSHALVEWAKAVRSGQLIAPPTVPIGLLLKTLQRVEELEVAINKVLDDEEANTGWGPDVTTVEYLRKAIGRHGV